MKKIVCDTGIAHCAAGKQKTYFASVKFGTRRKIVEVILLNFRSNLGHKVRAKNQSLEKEVFL